MGTWSETVHLQEDLQSMIQRCSHTSWNTRWDNTGCQNLPQSQK